MTEGRSEEEEREEEECVEGGERVEEEELHGAWWSGRSGGRTSRFAQNFGFQKKREKIDERDVVRFRLGFFNIGGRPTDRQALHLGGLC